MLRSRPAPANASQVIQLASSDARKVTIADVVRLADAA